MIIQISAHKKSDRELLIEYGAVICEWNFHTMINGAMSSSNHTLLVIPVSDESLLTFLGIKGIEWIKLSMNETFLTNPKVKVTPLAEYDGPAWWL